jgi:hypothetical protein
MTVTGRKAEGVALFTYARTSLRLNSPQTLTALARAMALVLDQLPDEGRALAVEAVIAVIKDRGFGDAA